MDNAMVKKNIEYFCKKQGIKECNIIKCLEISEEEYKNLFKNFEKPIPTEILKKISKRLMLPGVYELLKQIN